MNGHGRRLVVGGGRAAGFPLLGMGDVSINLDATAEPDVIGDVAMLPFAPGSFSEVYLERVPFMAFTGRRERAIGEVARVLRHGGTALIETGVVAPVHALRSALAGAGFSNIETAHMPHLGGYFLRITGTLRGS